MTLDPPSHTLGVIHIGLPDSRLEMPFLCAMRRNARTWSVLCLRAQPHFTHDSGNDLNLIARPAYCRSFWLRYHDAHGLWEIGWIRDLSLEHDLLPKTGTHFSGIMLWRKIRQTRRR